MRPRSKVIAPLTIEDLTPHDRAAVEGFAFFLLTAEKPSDTGAPHRQLARDWLEGLLTPTEGKRIVAGRQVWQ